MKASTKIPISRRYAHGTETKSETSRSQIESTLARYGATGFAFATSADRAQLMFEANGRRVRFDLPDPATTLQGYISRPTPIQLEAERRRLWRSLLMAIKAKLEVVASGITTFEVEFLPYVMVDAARTFADVAETPEFRNALALHKLPSMLSGGK